MRFFATLLLLAGALFGQDPLKPRIDEIAKPYLDQHVIVGMAVGVLKDGKAQVYGYGRNAAGGEDVPDSGTVFEIGSVSKVFTGALLALLARDKSVRLDQPVAELLPEGVTVPERGGKQITLLHLTTHTSALPRMPDNFAPEDRGNPYADYSVEQLHAFLSKCTLSRDIGSKYEYSNLGAGLLGHLLAHKAAMTYEQLLVARIAHPLGMQDTRIALTESMKKRLAPGHNAVGTPMRNWDFVTLAGAGGIRSTAGDMLLFLRAHLEEPQPRTTTRPGLLDACQVRYTPKNPQQHRLGLGWHISPRSGARWHNGQTGGYHSFVALHLDKRVAVVVLANTATPVVDQFGSTVMQLLMGKLDKPTVAVPANVLQEYAGVYATKSAPNVKLTVSVEQGRVYVQATGQGKLPIYPSSPTKFFYKVVDAQITFARTAGKVTGLTLHQGGRDVPFLRE